MTRDPRGRIRERASRLASQRRRCAGSIALPKARSRLDPELAFGHDKPRAAHANPASLYRDLDPARATERVTLLDGRGDALRDAAQSNKQSDQGTRRGSGCRILDDAHRRVEEPCVRDRPLTVDRIWAVEICALPADVCQEGREPGPSGVALSTAARSRTGTIRCAAPVETTRAGSPARRSARSRPRAAASAE